MSIVCYQAIVSGKVQKVGYRAWAKAEAEKLGLTGHAQNTTKGTVDIHIYGEATAAQTMLGLLFDGPKAARVGNVDVQQLNVNKAPPKSFKID